MVSLHENDQMNDQRITRRIIKSLFPSYKYKPFDYYIITNTFSELDIGNDMALDYVNSVNNIEKLLLCSSKSVPTWIKEPLLLFTTFFEGT